MAPRRDKANTFRRSSILFRPRDPQTKDVGGAAGYRPRVRSAYYERVYVHSPRRNTIHIGEEGVRLKGRILRWFLPHGAGGPSPIPKAHTVRIVDIFLSESSKCWASWMVSTIFRLILRQGPGLNQGWSRVAMFRQARRRAKGSALRIGALRAAPIPAKPLCACSGPFESASRIAQPTLLHVAPLPWRVPIHAFELAAELRRAQVSDVYGCFADRHA